MRRRPRIDLTSSQQGEQDTLPVHTTRVDDRLERKRKRWALVNKNKPPDENPFLAAIKPDHDNYGDPGETVQELRARLDSLEFGNYPGYFNYRNKAATSSANDKSSNLTETRHDSDKNTTNNIELGFQDQRMTLMKEEWFKDKNVLDVGCNRGHITYAIAKAFRPKFILGIDIDLKMIHMANRDLHLHLEQNLLPANLDFRIKRTEELSAEHLERNSSSGHDKTEVQYTEHEGHFTLSSYIGQGPLADLVPRSTSTSSCDNIETPGQIDGSNQIEERQLRPATISAFPNNLLFVEHNYVLSNDELVDKQKPFFDTIVCLSVTKWIHLNYRDAGLKRFFKRIYNHLTDAGLLILEVQPFDNYHRKKKLSDRLRTNFESITFKPEQFDEFLLSEQVGFKQILFSTTTSHECVGFKRPMKVFLK